MSVASEIEEWEKSVGRDVVRAHRTRRGWSQRQLSEAMWRLGFTSMMHTTIAKIEAGSRPLRLAEFVGIAQAFGMPWQSLMAEVEPMLRSDHPLAEMQKHVDSAVLREEEARREMLETIDKAVDTFASEKARRLSYAGELRRMSQGGGTGGAPSDPAE